MFRKHSINPKRSLLYKSNSYVKYKTNFYTIYKSNFYAKYKLLNRKKKIFNICKRNTAFVFLFFIYLNFKQIII